MKQLKWFKLNHDQSKLSACRTHKCCSSYYPTLNRLTGLLEIVLIVQTVTGYSNLQRLVPDSILSAKWRLSKIQTNKETTEDVATVLLKWLRHWHKSECHKNTMLYLKKKPLQHCNQSLHCVDHNHRNWKRQIYCMRTWIEPNNSIFRNRHIWTCRMWDHLNPTQTCMPHAKSISLGISLVR